jgi:UDP-N-acetylmuramate: L-alanyl-gamma-D-glutamyl-meso-diaminopimelate ligase
MKHLHILGICGTFMGGIAAIARDAGFKVTGCDAQVYPPMSTQLQQLGIDLIEGFSVDQLALKPDLFIVGNVVSRGNALMEAILNQKLPYTSGPQWLKEQVLQKKQVIAVSGTHGKTTTSSMVAFMLERLGLNPCFLIGGVPQDFSVSARITDSPYFVIEADEYDTAFFDKRSKFIHYPASTAILNNLEFDHADIFKDLEAIETQFHHWIRTLPSQAMILSHQPSSALSRVLSKGCWSQLQSFGTGGDWFAGEVDQSGGFDVFFREKKQGHLSFSLLGEHNQSNALAAIAAVSSLGIDTTKAIEALSTFGGVKRRMELKGNIKGIAVYDDFAHHPTAIKTTLDGLKQKLKRENKTKDRIIAVLEPRSNTMKLGVMKAQLPESLQQADLVFGYGAQAGKDVLGWNLQEVLAPLEKKARAFDDLDILLNELVASLREGDHVVLMSNGGFGGIHQKLLDRLMKI